jgi:hypothetical protein
VVEIPGRDYIDEWMDKVTIFLDYAFSLSKIVRCPCNRCQNMRCLEGKRTIVIHLCKNDFVSATRCENFTVSQLLES